MKPKRQNVSLLFCSAPAKQNPKNTFQEVDPGLFSSGQQQYNNNNIDSPTTQQSFSLSSSSFPKSVWPVGNATANSLAASVAGQFMALDQDQFWSSLKLKKS
jgi:hypothetical protein